VAHKGRKELSARLRFARGLRRLRSEQGLSQEDLAGLANLHRTYVGSVERGERNISIDNMEAIAIALGVDLCEVLCPPESPIEGS
jgi:transcriptional regulator with XRE-family HTH domain